MGDSSVLSHKFVAFQQGDKRPDARRAGAGLVIPSQVRATTQMGAYRLALRERPKSTTAVLQGLEIVHYYCAPAPSSGGFGAL